jgi:hypothetical protein
MAKKKRSKSDKAKRDKAWDRARVLVTAADAIVRLLALLGVR